MYTAEQMKGISNKHHDLLSVRDRIISHAKSAADLGSYRSLSFIHKSEYQNFKSINHEELLKLFLELNYYAEIKIYDLEDKEGYIGEVVLEWDLDEYKRKGIIRKENDMIAYYLEDKELKRVVDK